MEYKPHSYQRYSIEQIIEHEREALFLDMGLGKTSIVLTAIEALYERLSISRVLIIAPLSVAKSTWSAEATKWDHTKDLKVVKVLGSEKQRLAALNEDADIWVTNREQTVWLERHFGNKWPFDMVVIDESSSFKSPQAERWKALKRIAPKVDRMVLLTGTPTPNGLMDLWAQMYLLDRGERLGKYITHYRERFFAPDKRGPNGVVYSYRLKQGAEAKILESISDISVSMKAEDYLELPECVEQEIVVTLSDKARKAYEKLEREYIMELPEGEEVSALSAATLSNKLLQISNGAVYDEEHVAHVIHDDKLNALKELLESLGDEHVLLFYQYQHDKERIIDALGIKNAREVRVYSDDQDIKDWNAGKVDVLLCHPASTAYGLNLQEGGHHVVWFGLTWNYEQYTQANKRLHRQGQTKPVIVHLLVSEGTRDADVIKALKRKGSAQDYMLEQLKARIEEVRACVR